MARLVAEEGCQKKQHTSAEMLDRFSNLPETVIHYIFSFLEMDDITRVGVLSKRFRQMFVSSPYVMFKSPSCSRDEPSKCENFVDYVDSFLNLRNGLEIRSLSLHWRCHNCNCCTELNYAHNWINIAVDCQVQELDIDIGAFRFQGWDFEYGVLDKVVYDIPHCIFDSKILRVLKLNLHGQILEEPRGVLVSLEELSLRMLEVTDDALKEWISLACPSLKKLTLRDLHEIKNLIILNQCLETLTIVNISYNLSSIEVTGDSLQSLFMDLNSIFPGFTCTLKINAPNLIDLRWAARSPSNISLSEFKYIHNAAICVGIEDHYLAEASICNRSAELLHAVRNATTFQINIDILVVLFLNDRLPDMFDNLRSLVITVDGLMDCHFPVIASILMRSLNLETLSIKCKTRRYQADYVKILRVRASKISKQHEGFQDLIGDQLKEIEIELQGRGHRVGMVENLLKVSKGLTKMTIVYSRENYNALSKIAFQNSEPTFLPLEEVNLVEKEFPVDYSLYSFSL